jgi:hypothetical protein
MYRTSTKGHDGGGRRLRGLVYLTIVLCALCLFISHGNVTLRTQLSRLPIIDDDAAARLLASAAAATATAGAGHHEPRYLLDTAWSPDPMLGLIKTNLYLTNDVRVFIMPPKPDYDPLEGNIVDYLALGLIEHPRSVDLCICVLKVCVVLTLSDDTHTIYHHYLHRVVLVDTKEEADVLFSIAAWTNEHLSLGYDEEMANNPYWSRVIVVDEMDHFNDATHV